MKPDREYAWNLLNEYVKTDSQLKHALSVEGAMRQFARLFGEDEETWGITGLLHDLDYEQYPDKHCVKVREILESRGVDELYIRAIQSHGYGLCVDVEPLTNMEKTLYTIDELTGLITAAALMRPSKSVLDIEVPSVKKKYKDKRFAAGVSREVIEDGARRMNMSLDEVIQNTILGMREVAEAIGLGM
jgi:predicted hydrolase (HD superfamily)